MVQRPSQGFFGGLMVFPGGALESCDFAADVDFDDSEHRMAGIRETAEEVGFVVTSTGLVPSPRTCRFGCRTASSTHAAWPAECCPIATSPPI
jgi:8-oxo-dGTP pyrophosphatase MutT (NUDIX family)